MSMIGFDFCNYIFEKEMETWSWIYEKMEKIIGEELGEGKTMIKICYMKKIKEN